LNDIAITVLPNSTTLAMDTVAKTFRYLDTDEIAAQRKAKAPAGGAKK
jgi:type IV pilus assembly protein PilO